MIPDQTTSETVASATSDQMTPEDVRRVILSEAKEIPPDALSERNQALELREKWSKWLLLVMVGQLVIVDAFVVLIGLGLLEYESQSVLLNIFVGSTFVQICGLVYIVVNHLFPQRK